MLEDPQESQDDACRKLFKKGCLKKKKKINLNVITLKQLAKVRLKMLLKNYLRWRTLECGVSVVFLFLREREYINLYLHIHLVNFCNMYMISMPPLCSCI